MSTTQLRSASLGLLLVMLAGPWAVSAQQAAAGRAPSRLILTPGELFTLELQADIDRLAVGSPNIADVTMLSAKELLVQARSVGATNLIIWHVNEPQTEIIINVMDPRPLNVSKDLTRILSRDEKFSKVKVELEQDKVFLMGEVPDDEVYAALMELVSSYPDVVINMVNIAKADEFEIPKAMIELKTRLIELTRTENSNLGINWSTDMTVVETQPFDMFTVNSAHSIGEVLGKWGEGAGRTPLLATLNMLISEGKAKVLSEPLLVTTSGKPASAHLGIEVPIIKSIDHGREDDNRRTITVEYREVGVVLKMTPTALDIQGQPRINVLLMTEVSSVDPASGLDISDLVRLPAFKVRTTETEVTSAPGQTFVIAGLLSSTEEETVARVPYLSKIPGVGKLFRSPVKGVNQTELLITVTPDFVGDVYTPRAAREVAFQQAVSRARETKESYDPVLEYARQVQVLVAGQLKYPTESLADKSLAVRLRLQILRDGTLEQVILSQPSGEDLFDYSAIAAASSIESYPALPESVSGPDLWVEVPIVFRP